MSLFGPPHQTAVCLPPVGLTGLYRYEVLTDAPLTDSEMSASLAEADSHIARSQGRTFQATAVAAADQHSATTDALSLSRVRSDAAAEVATLAIRVGAMTSDLIQAESAGLEVVRLALDQAMQGEDVEVITMTLTNLRHAVVAAKSVVSTRRSSTGQDQVVVPGEGNPAGGPGREGDGESAGADWPGEGGPESSARADAPSGSEPSDPQGSAEPAQGPPS